VAFFLLCFVGFAVAQESSALFETGNTAYGNGHFQAALEAYNQLWQRGVNDGALAFNLGNAHYKLGHVGEAVLFYERAARLLPGDEDVAANLQLASESIVDQIESRELFFLVKYWRRFIAFWPRGLLLGITVGLYGLLSLCIAFMIWRRHLTWLRGVSVSLGGLWLISALLFWGQWQETHRVDEAIVMGEAVSVMSAPNQEMAVELFVIHEGLKVKTDQRSAPWVEIILPDGKVGWVDETVLEWINNAALPVIQAREAELL